MTYRVEMVVFLAVVAFTYLSISRPFGRSAPGVAHRADLFDRERGELNIDRLVAAGATEDWARHGGHFYSKKAPGPALLPSPCAFVQNRIQRAMGVADDNSRARWVATYLANVATYFSDDATGAALLVTVLMGRMALSSGRAFALCGTWAVGSMALPYSVMFFGHQSAGAFFASARLTGSNWNAREPAAVIALAGLAMGLAVVSIFCWRVGRRVDRLPGLAHGARAARARGLGRGGAGPLAVVMAYDAVCFGSPFTTAYNLSISPSLRSDRRLGVAQPGQASGHHGPSLARMFYATPVFALTVVPGASPRRCARQAR